MQGVEEGGGGGGLCQGEGGRGSRKNPPPALVCGRKGQRKISLMNAEEILRPKAEENFFPKNRTQDLWAGSYIARGLALPRSTWREGQIQLTGNMRTWMRMRQWACQNTFRQ